MEGVVPVLDVAHEHERVEHALDASTPAQSESDLAYRGLQEAVRKQVVAISNSEITSKTLSQLQRFCAAVGTAMVTLEKPDALVRSRFKSIVGGINVMNPVSYGEDSDEEALAPAPAYETYGANASRGLIETAAQVAKDVVVAQAKAQREARQPTLSEMVTSLALAKNAKLPRKVLQALERQIEATSLADAPPAVEPSALPALPAPKTKKKRGQR